MQLIEINKTEINGTEVNAVNARDLHKALNLKSDFSTWIKKELDIFVENEDYIRFHKKMEANNATLIEYILTLDTAKHLAMIQRNEKGREVRDYFIQVEKEAKRPRTYEEIMKEALLLADEKVKELESKIETDKPKVTYATAVLSASNGCSIREWVSTMKEEEGLKVGERKVIKFLLDEKYLYRDKKGKLKPYADKFDYFSLEPVVVASPKGNHEFMSLKITGMGQVVITQKVMEHFDEK